MVVQRVRRANLAHNRQWTLKQYQALTTPKRILCLDGGRRFGKTYTSVARFLSKLLARHDEEIRKVKRGDRRRWAGLSMPRSRAQHYIDDIVKGWVITPRQRHLEQCRSYILSYFNGPFARLLHPDMGLMDQGRQIWIVYGGIASQIRFIVGSGETAVASTAIDVLLVDECGLLHNEIMDAALPMLWERSSDLIFAGTPSLGVDHWFSQMCLRGLDQKHPFYKPDIVEPDPEVETIIGSSYEAFDLLVRKKARIEAKHKGASWESQWVLGDWRLPDLFVYDDFSRDLHIADYDYESFTLNGVRLPKPSTIAGFIDWSYSPRKPGAVVIFHRWAKNPLDNADTRPLIIAVEDLQQAKTYTADGWYQDMRDLREKYGFGLWYADPSMKEMIYNARRMHIGKVKGADKADKAGRINLVKSLLHHRMEDGIEPAFYLSKGNCRNLERQFENYRYRVDSRGEPTDTTFDHDDHCLDCVAFAMGIWVKGGYFMGEGDLY